MAFAALNGEGDQLPEVMNVDAPYKWMNQFDGMDGPDDALDALDGHLVHQSNAVREPGPPDLCERPSKRTRVEEENEALPPWLASGRFTEQYTGTAATALGRKQTVFESLEAAELEKGEGDWAPFRNEDEWEFACFLMKNLGQTKIDELLKLAQVSETKTAHLLDADRNP